MEGGGGGMRILSKRKVMKLQNVRLKKPREPSPLYWAILPQRNSLFSIFLRSAEKRLTFVTLQQGDHYHYAETVPNWFLLKLKAVQVNVKQSIARPNFCKLSNTVKTHQSSHSSSFSFSLLIFYNSHKKLLI